MKSTKTAGRGQKAAVSSSHREKEAVQRIALLALDQLSGSNYKPSESHFRAIVQRAVAAGYRAGRRSTARFSVSPASADTHPLQTAGVGSSATLMQSRWPMALREAHLVADQTLLQECERMSRSDSRLCRLSLPPTVPHRGSRMAAAVLRSALRALPHTSLRKSSKVSVRVSSGQSAKAGRTAQAQRGNS